MKKVFAATVIGAVLAASTAFATESFQTVQSTVARVDPTGNAVTLVNGMTLTVPSNVSIEPLQAGEDVTIAYQDGKDGQKQLRAFWIDAGAGGHSKS